MGSRLDVVQALIEDPETDPPEHRPRFRIVVIPERCKECGLCIHVCPKNVLEKGTEANARGYRYPVPARPEDCVGCRLCEFNCPDFAIYVVPAR